MDDQARGGPRPGEGNESAGLSPVRAFFLLGAILAAVFAGFLATREESPATETVAPARSPDYSLTDAEAIAEFERLHALQVQAYEERDLSLLPRTYTTTSPIARRVEREIAALLRKRVTTETNFATRRIAVRSRTATEIVVHQIAVVDARFLDAAGKDVSIDAPKELQEIRWTIRQEDHEWLIHDAEILSSEALPGGRR